MLLLGRRNPGPVDRSARGGPDRAPWRPETAEIYHSGETCQASARYPSPAMSLRTTPLKAARSIGLATLSSRILGLVRDQVASYYFGAGAVMDSFFTAFRIPNLLRDLFAEGALSSAFVPTLTAERERHGEAEAWRLVNRVMSALIVILGVLTVLIFLFAPSIQRLYASGASPEKLALTITMTRIMAPFLLFVALAAAAMGTLNTRGRFFLPALAPASFNVAVIVAVVALYPAARSAGLNPGLALAVGAIVGGALQLLVQVPALRREGFRFRFDLAPADPGLRRVATLMAPATFGLAATQINILVDTALANRMGDGPVAWLQFGFRLMQLPLGLFGVAIGMANLAFVSRDVARSDSEGLRKNLAGSLRAAALLTLPATAGLIVLCEPIVRVIFEHGAFTASDTLQTAAAVACYGVGLYAYSVTKIQVPTFYALGETRLPVIASATAVAVKIAASFALIAFLPSIGLRPFLGLALSTSLAAWINFAMLSWGLKMRVGSLRGHGVVSMTIKVAVLAGVMAAACRGSAAVIGHVWGGGGLLGEIVRLVTVIALGVAIVYAGARAMGIREMDGLLARIKSR